MKRLLAALLATGFFSGAGWAQEGGVWLQVEALPTLSRAETRARAYAGRFEAVSGYALGTGWYGIALGPYDPAEARRLLGELKAAGAIPGDAFVADGAQYRSRFWPVGARGDAPGVARALTAPTATSTEAPAADTAPDAPATDTPDATDTPAAEAPRETLAEARASERALDGTERERLQIALRWAGVYDAGIDGAFGAGTRSAMADWQRQNGYEDTGVLTSTQRAALLGAYDAVLDGLGLAAVTDDQAGIEIVMPTALVARSEAQPPFVPYEASGDEAVRVLLISQPGDTKRLAGLYEILQTLEVVPPEGARGLDARSFVIEGADDNRVTHVEAALIEGAIKGFALVWPANDESRRTRVLSEMTASFKALPGVLERGQVPADEEQSIDLVSGLQIRAPLRERAGVFVDASGTVATAAEAVAGCGDVAIDGQLGATLLMEDAASGLALLRPATPLAPRGVATFQTGVPRIGDKVAVAGFPYGAALSVAATTFGRLADIRGLGGEEDLKRLELNAQPGDAGGPVLDMGGAVLGLLLPGDREAGRVLPSGVALALESDTVLAALDAVGVEGKRTEARLDETVQTVARRAGEMTALVSCWE
ncbi:trypsin-like peptidase domain-containing protein [uncultured Limimaricola sp.]|uniref:trypsin-like peptidase domain-containing protein n=1 Tax=uncultured Limimaricola sp. TaxID=2211667 RepID=UPI0030F58393